MEKLGSPAASTCATDGERVVSYFGSYGLSCFDLDGNRLLRFRPLEDFVSPDWHFHQFEIGERHCGAVAVQKQADVELQITMRDWRSVFLGE